MFRVTVKNRQTGQVIKEEPESEKELDSLVDSLHSIYGEHIDIHIEKPDALPGDPPEEEIETCSYNDKPDAACPGCADPDLIGECKLCGTQWFDIKLEEDVQNLTMDDFEEFEMEDIE